LYHTYCLMIDIVDYKWKIYKSLINMHMVKNKGYLFFLKENYSDLEKKIQKNICEYIFVIKFSSYSGILTEHFITSSISIMHCWIPYRAKHINNSMFIDDFLKWRQWPQYNVMLEINSPVLLRGCTRYNIMW
jgi:hypothetical protein